jgi:hypothetical protein
VDLFLSRIDELLLHIDGESSFCKSYDVRIALVFVIWWMVMHMYIIRRRGRLADPVYHWPVILRSSRPAILHSLYPPILHPPRPAPSCFRFLSLRGLGLAPKSAASALVQRNLYTVVLLSACSSSRRGHVLHTTAERHALPRGYRLLRCGESDFLSIGGIPKSMSARVDIVVPASPETRPRRLTMFLRVGLSPQRRQVHLCDFYIGAYSCLFGSM